MLFWKTVSVVTESSKDLSSDTETAYLESSKAISLPGKSI